AAGRGPTAIRDGYGQACHLDGDAVGAWNCTVASTTSSAAVAASKSAALAFSTIMNPSLLDGPGTMMKRIRFPSSPASYSQAPVVYRIRSRGIESTFQTMSASTSVPLRPPTETGRVWMAVYSGWTLIQA